jgi:hypothetical protein
MGPRRRALRALLAHSELSGCSIRRILLADVCADLLQFEPDVRYCVTSGPEMLTREVLFFSYPEYQDYRERNQTLSGLTAYAPVDLTLDGSRKPSVPALLVSWTISPF